MLSARWITKVTDTRSKYVNTYCFSTETMVLQKYLNVMFISTLPVLMWVSILHRYPSTQYAVTVTNNLLSLDTPGALSLKSVCWYLLKVCKKDAQTHHQKCHPWQELLHKTLSSSMCNGKQNRKQKRAENLLQALTPHCSNIYCCSKLHGNVCAYAIYTI